MNTLLKPQSERKPRPPSVFGPGGFESFAEVVGRLGQKQDARILFTAGAMAGLIARYGLDEGTDQSEAGHLMGTALRIGDDPIRALDGEL